MIGWLCRFIAKLLKGTTNRSEYDPESGKTVKCPCLCHEFFASRGPYGHTHNCRYPGCTGWVRPWRE